MRAALVVATVIACKGGDGKPAAGSAGPAAGSAAPPAAGGTPAKKFAACSFVTAKDAEALFGQPAKQTQGPTTDRHGECRWDYDAPDNSSQLLQLLIWTEEFHKQGGDTFEDGSQPFGLGDKGAIKVNDLTGVDVEWVQGDRYIQLSYSSVGPSAPKASTKAEDVKALAKKVSAAL